MSAQTALAVCVAVLLICLGGEQPRAQQVPDPQAKTVPQIVKETAQSIFLIIVQIPGGQAQGSGFVASEDGLIVTNHHVVEDALSVSVKLPNGAFYKVLGLVAVDKARDLAVIKVDGTGFIPLRMANFEDVQVGEDVVAIGSPRGLEASVSTGIVSAFRNDDGFTRIQTTAPISAGSSGGVLLNRRGEVVGITTSSVRAGQNLNFAIPSNYIRPLLSSRGLKTVTGLILSSDSPGENLQAVKSKCAQIRCGTVRLRVSPGDARILVDGAPVGQVREIGQLGLPPGVHRMSFDALGFLAETRDVTVVAGQTVTVRVSLKRAF